MKPLPPKRPVVGSGEIAVLERKSQQVLVALGTQQSRRKAKLS